LPLLDTSSIEEYFRIWSDVQLIEICRDTEGSISGKLITWADEDVSNTEEQTNRRFIITKKINEDTAKLIRDLIYFSNILTLPTGDSIKGWQQGFDGIIYTIEYSTRSKYSFKTYWTPKAQDSLKEAVQVQEFIDNAFKLSNAKIAWREFSKMIPYECYSYGMSVVCKGLTKQEHRKYKLERKKYCRQKHLSKP
jgi:hypothetical protein